MEYENFEKIFRFLGENDFKIINFEEIRSGRNSLTLKLFCEKQVLFLKKYKSKFNDDRDRLNAEKNFLNLLSLENFDNVPKPILFSEEYNFALLSWIDGESINKPEISDWNKFLEFLSDIRKINNKKLTYSIENASEACFDMVGHINLVEKSIINLIQLLKKKNYFYEINNWLSKNLLMPIQEIKELENKSAIANKIKNKSVSRILSQSDIGFHNIIKSNNKLYFFDFEYAGWDDPYKQYSDLIIQPENVLDYKSAINIINKFSILLDEEINFELLKEYICLYKLKWTVIILKQLLNKNIKNGNEEKIFNKAKRYYYFISEIWSHQ